MTLELIDIHTHDPADNASGTFLKSYILEKKSLTLQKNLELSLGLHPWKIKLTEEENRLLFEEMSKKIKNDHYVAIGETGFDRYFRKDLSLELQEKIFFWHYDLALELNRPLILHIVHAHDLFLKVLKRIQKPKVPMLIHDFRGGSEETKKYLKFDNLHFSFGKSLLSSDKKTFERFLSLPISRVHLETDGDPKLSLLAVYEKAAEKTVGDLEKLACEMKKNAQGLFGIDFN